MNDKELKIKVSMSKTGNVLRDLNKELTETKNHLAKLKLAGKENSSEYQKLSQTYKQLTTTKQSLNKEFKNLSGNTKTSGRDMLALTRDITVAYHGIKQFASAMKNAFLEGAEFGVFKDNFIAIAGSVEEAERQLKLLRGASTGNLNEQELILYTNKMRLLGFSIEDTAKLLDIVDVQSDKVKIGFEEGERVLQKYLLTGRDTSLMELGINVSDVNSKIAEQTGLTEKQIKQLDDETQQRIRLNAILGLNIGTTGDLNNKQKDQADKIKSVETALKNVTLNYQYTIANGVVKFAESLGLSDKAMESTIGKVGFVGKSLADLLPVLATLKIAFPAAFTGLVGLLNPVTIGLAGILASIIGIYAGVKKIIDLVDQEGWGTFAPTEKDKWGDWDDWNPFSSDFWSNSDASKSSEELGIDVGNKYVEGIVQGIQDKKKQAEEKIKLDADIKKQLDDITKKSGGKGGNKQKQELTWLGEQLKKQKELTNEVKYLYDLSKDVTQETWIRLNAYNLLIEKQKELNKLVFAGIDLSQFKSKTSEDFWNAILKDEEFVIKARIIQDNLPLAPLRNINKTDQLINEFSTLNSDEEKEQFLDNITKEMLDSVGTVFSEITNIMNVLGIESDSFVGRMIGGFNSVLSIISSIMGIVEAAKTVGGIFDFLKIAFLATGGTATSNQPYIVGEKGAELFVPNTSGIVIPNWITESIMKNGGSISGNNRFLENGGYVRPQMMNPIINVVVESEVERIKAVRFYQNTFDDYTNREAKKSI